MSGRKKTTIPLPDDVVAGLIAKAMETYQKKLDEFADFHAVNAVLKRFSNGPRTDWAEITKRLLGKRSANRGASIETRKVIAAVFEESGWDNFIIKYYPHHQNLLEINIAKGLQRSLIRTTNNELEDYLQKLKYLYNETYQLEEGSRVAEEAICNYPDNLDIVRWWALFHNRTMDWDKVCTRLTKMAKQAKDDKIKTECYLAGFESFLNTFIRQRHIRTFEKLLRAKADYLDQVPNKQTTGKYYYFLARYYEAEWWTFSDEAGKIASMTILIDARKAIEKAISIYPTLTGSGYSGTYATPWWLYCHKALLEKITEHHDYTKSIEEFLQIIKPLAEEKSATLKKSLQFYMTTYYILKDDVNGLKTFLKRLDTRIRKRLKELKFGKNYEANAVESYSCHHIDLIYWREEDKTTKVRYYKIMNDFQNNCPW